MLLQMAFLPFNDLTTIPLYMFHIFIHSSVDGNLGCFHDLAAVNRAVVYTGVHVSFWIIVFLDICSGVRLLDYTVLFLSF